MTDYSSASHQQMYDYVNSGSWSTVQNEADLNTKHSTSVASATTDLHNTLTKIQSAWEGAAADQFTEQTNSIVNEMHQHATNADNVAKAMAFASSSLKWAQTYMPAPPSAAEQALADVNSNPISEWGLGIATGGGSYVASKAAQDDIAQKKAVATQVMTQLASAYTQGSSQLQLTPRTPGWRYQRPYGGPGHGSNGNGKGRPERQRKQLQQRRQRKRLQHRRNHADAGRDAELQRNWTDSSGSTSRIPSVS